METERTALRFCHSGAVTMPFTEQMGGDPAFVYIL
jgi:hypothetical protein